jgi:SAM-dependent methyltransferase
VSAAERDFGLGQDPEVIRTRVGGPSGDAPTPLPPLPRHRRLRIAVRRRVPRLKARGVNQVLRVVEKAWRPRRATCAICGWHGFAFRALIGPGWVQYNAVCPQCSSVQRHRLLAAVLERLEGVDGPTVWMAPERWLGQLVEDVTGDDRKPITIDIESDGVDVLADAEALPLPDRAVGFLFSSDVLEHVADDRRALLEISRVLTTGGVAVLHVPVLATSTVEYGFANAAEFGHRRAYGPDVLDLFDPAGLTVEIVRARSFTDRERARLGLLPWDAAFIARLKRP